METRCFNSIGTTNLVLSAPSPHKMLMTKQCVTTKTRPFFNLTSFFVLSPPITYHHIEYKKSSISTSVITTTSTCINQRHCLIKAPSHCGTRSRSSIVRSKRYRSSSPGISPNGLTSITRMNMNSTNNNNLPSWQFAYVLSSFCAAVTGGHVLFVVSLAYLLLARFADAPAWLCVSAALFSSALMDAVIVRTGLIIPFQSANQAIIFSYFVFISGFIASSVLDFDQVFRTFTPGNPPLTPDDQKETIPTNTNAIDSGSDQGDGEIGKSIEKIGEMEQIDDGRTDKNRTEEIGEIMDTDIAKWDRKMIDMQTKVDDQDSPN